MAARPLILAAALTAASAATSAAGARAAPTVVADIAPVHALAARVMQGVGAPTLLLPPGASPHGYAMRPSEAASLETADIVFWVGEALTPWLARGLDALASRADVVALAAAPGVTRLPLREDARFEAHDHADHADAARDHDHKHDDVRHGDDARGDHAQGEHKQSGHKQSWHKQGGHAHDDHAHGDHAHGDHADIDPHLWLDPANAAAWLDAMAAALAAADPANAAAYAANAAAGRAELVALGDEIDAAVGPARGRGYIVAHDAYQYFEARFDMPASGAIALTDARAPGAARVAEIRKAVEAAEVACVFTEPQLSAALAATLVEGTRARLGVLDPLGATLEPGAALYPAMMRALAASLADCLRPAS